MSGAACRRGSPRTGSRSSASPRRRSPEGSIPEVTLYHAEGCHLCERARAQLQALQTEDEFELREVDITGDPALEARYREWLPVVELDGERICTYYVQPEPFRRKLAQSRAAERRL